MAVREARRARAHTGSTRDAARSLPPRSPSSCSSSLANKSGGPSYMSSRRVQWWKSIGCLIPLCAASGALVLGCGGDVAAGEPQGELAGAQPALAAGCASTGAPGAWSNQTFPDQAKRFHVELDATPSASGIDAV